MLSIAAALVADVPQTGERGVVGPARGRAAPPPKVANVSPRTDRRVTDRHTHAAPTRLRHDPDGRPMVTV